MIKCKQCIYFISSACHKNAPSPAYGVATKLVWPELSPEDGCGEGEAPVKVVKAAAKPKRSFTK